MLSEFGKAIRKARVETGETLSTMAKGLSKTVSFLSAIETGRKKIPLDLVPKIVDYLVGKGADKNLLESLESHAILSNQEINLSGLNPELQKTIVKFAKSELSQEQLDEITKILDLE